MTDTNSTLNRLGRVLIILLVIALVIVLCWISMPVLIPFLVGILLAYLLFPLVKGLESMLPPRGKERTGKRVIAVIIVFLLFTLFLIAFIVLVGTAIVTAFSALVDKAPEFMTKSLGQASEWLTPLETKASTDTIAKVKESLINAGPAIGKFLQDFVVGSLAVIPASFPTVMGFITLPIFLIFALINYEKYGQYFHDIFPGSMARHSARIFTIFGDQIGKYFRMMIIIASIAGALVFIGLAVLGVEFAAVLGVVTALTQFIPIIGPFISAGIILVVVLALKPGVILWALGVIIVAQLIVMLVQGPLQGKHFPLDPAIVMVLMTVGGFIGSYLGMVLTLPVGATIWDIYKYFRDERRAGQAAPDTGVTRGQ